MKNSGFQYLTPSQNSFWQWAEDGTAIEWCDGKTIAFRDEIWQVLDRLKYEGFPPFDIVVLVLAMCRAGLSADLSRAEAFRSFLESVSATTPGTNLADVMWTGTPGLETGLKKLSSLPPCVLRSHIAKAEILSILYDPAHLRCSNRVAEEVLDAVKSGFPNEDLTAASPVDKPSTRWFLDLRWLRFSLNDKLDEETIENLLATGIEETVEPAPVEVIPPEIDEPLTVRELLVELERDPEMRGLARLTKHLMAVVHLPRPVSDFGELPVGGVSDLTNRGPLDQLLLSELANDDDVLMTRVAMKEALYIRRETPPGRPPQDRTLLLDVRLRMWGLPRVYATAVALALAALGKGNTDVVRAERSKIVDVDLTCKTGVTEQMGALQPTIHPGAAIPAFLKRVSEADQEIILITGEDVWADEEFRQTLKDVRLPILFVATVSREGRFQLWSKTAKGERLVRESQLDLNQLLRSDDKPRKPLRDPSVDSHLPAILRLEFFPLRLPHALDDQRTVTVHWGSDSKVLSLPHDGRLMLWDETSRYARQLSEEMPRGRILSSRQDGEAMRFVVGSLRGKLSLVWCNLLSLEWGVHRIETAAGSKAVCQHAGHIFVIQQESVEVFDGESAEHRFSHPLRNSGWISNRFFLRPEGICAVSLGGQGVKFECLVYVGNLRAECKPVHVFDSAVVDGPVVVYEDGSFQIPPGQVVKVPISRGRWGRFVGVAEDGSSYAISYPTVSGRTSEVFGVSLPKGVCHLLRGPRVSLNQKHWPMSVG
ncbi:MAG: hypothetical protein KDA69_13795, partial [Planctomycetaceae bacterium]|nr:hypothetical protein [Planctomycetaceae bacterium]